MSSAAIATLVLIALIAVVSPVLSELSGRLEVPEIVFQLGLGIVIGPYALGIADLDTVIRGLSNLGLSYLIFLAGYELETERMRGRPLRLAVVGWVISLAVGFAVAFEIVTSGLARDTVVIGLALTTTALGPLTPVLRDAGVLPTRFGSYVMAIGTVGEFGPIVAVALVLTGKEPIVTSLLLVAFVAVAAATVVLAARTHPPRLIRILSRHLESSAQLPVRLSLLMIVLLVLLADRLGLDVLLGAFAAGVVVRRFAAGRQAEIVRAKLEAIGFGFLVPIFFVVSGIAFNLHVFIGDPAAVWRIPFFLVLMLLARGIPVYVLYRHEVPRRQLAPMALFSATGLPLIVVITTVASTEGRILPVNASSLVAAGLLSVILFPATALALLREVRPAPAPAQAG
ncbi:MAG TPA: cation:proton antiporter [Acidimicrobiales bacterium]|nr:cation:proton antiporter [Acidimicrobiales bacterium]